MSKLAVLFILWGENPRSRGITEGTCTFRSVSSSWLTPSTVFGPLAAHCSVLASAWSHPISLSPPCSIRQTHVAARTGRRDHLYNVCKQPLPISDTTFWILITPRKWEPSQDPSVTFSSFLSAPLMRNKWAGWPPSRLSFSWSHYFCHGVYFQIEKSETINDGEAVNNC